MIYDKSVEKTGGFTLIELLIVFSIMAILSLIGIASLVGYSHSEEVTTSFENVKTTLTTARSRALSQLKQGTCGASGSNEQLQGYQVVFCCNFSACQPTAQTKCNLTGYDYELQIVCSNGSGITNETVDQAKFTTTNVSLSSSNTKTTATYVFFGAITGAVTTNNTSSNPSQVTISGYGINKTVQVSATGVIQ